MITGDLEFKRLGHGYWQAATAAVVVRIEPFGCPGGHKTYDATIRRRGDDLLLAERRACRDLHAAKLWARGQVVALRRRQRAGR